MNSKRKRACEVRGSLTVEAVFVVPLCLMVIFVLLTLGLYEHHKSYYAMAAWESILCGTDEYEVHAGEAQKHWEDIKNSPVIKPAQIRATASGNTAIVLQYQGKIRGIWGFSDLPFKRKVAYEEQMGTDALRKAACIRQLRGDG